MLHDQTNEIKNRHKQRHETYEIQQEFKARRAQGGKGLLSQSISVQESQKSINKVLVLEKKEKNRRKGERAPGKGRQRAI